MAYDPKRDQPARDPRQPPVPHEGAEVTDPGTYGTQIPTLPPQLPGGAPPSLPPVLPPQQPPGGVVSGAGNQDAGTLPADLIGDIPPPPIPPPPGVGVAGQPGAEGSTFARPGSAGARPFRTPAFFSQRPPRFGPGVPVLGGGSADVSGLGGEGLGISPEEAAELLAQLAAGGGGGGFGG